MAQLYYEILGNRRRGGLGLRKWPSAVTSWAAWWRPCRWWQYWPDLALSGSATSRRSPTMPGTPSGMWCRPLPHVSPLPAAVPRLGFWLTLGASVVITLVSFVCSLCWCVVSGSRYGEPMSLTLLLRSWRCPIWPSGCCSRLWWPCWRGPPPCFCLPWRGQRPLVTLTAGCSGCCPWPASGWAGSTSKVGQQVEAGSNLLIDEIHDPKKVIPLRMAPLVLSVLSSLTRYFSSVACAKVRTFESLGTHGRFLRCLCGFQSAASGTTTSSANKSWLAQRQGNLVHEKLVDQHYLQAGCCL